MVEKSGNAQWPGWETIRQIGDGSFGFVYEIERDVFGQKEKAALKVITIPQKSSDIDALRSEGYDNASITETFKRYLEDIVNEYSLMRKLSGSANVVNCDDVRYVQHDDGFGWDVYIKMELLTPLMKVIDTVVSDEQVIQIGIDICKALILCKKHNIVHRDIKPENIFISENGDYKLGDFGVAKIMEKTSGGTNKIGTYDFMAPEVYNDEPYDSAADRYSLGLVLYWLLNDRRTPFLPLPPAQPGNNEKINARKQRFRGETIPAPAHGSWELQQVVLKACAYNQEDRYQSAEEFCDALVNSQSGTIGWEWICQRCGTRNNHAAQKCRKCGADKNPGKSKKKWKCKKCGYRNELTTQICENCGAKRIKRKLPLWAKICSILAIFLLAGTIAVTLFPHSHLTLSDVSFNTGKTTENPSYATEMEYYRESADNGNVEAMNKIGAMFFYGERVTQDYERALEWFKNAADAGDAKGMHNTGYVYDVLGDYSNALEWYRKAADAGNTRSMCNIGWLYLNGLGVDKSQSIATEWYKKSGVEGIYFYGIGT